MEELQMRAKDQLHILNEKINKARREHQVSYVITIQDEIDIHLALKDEPKQVTDEEIKAEAYEDNAEIDGDGFPILKYAYCDTEADAFFEGAKWMRNQIGGGK